MDEGQNFFTSLFSALSKRQKIAVFVFLAALIVIITAILIYNSTSNQVDEETAASASHINIENFSELMPDTPEFFKTQTEADIWNLLKNYNNLPEDTYATAEIRDNTYNINESDYSPDIYNSEFVVDIPSLEHSYMVSFSWSENSSADDFEIFIDCPYASDVIYENSDCFISDQPLDSVAKYLPTYIHDSNDTEIYLSIITQQNQQSLSVDFYSCKDEYPSVKGAVTQWLKDKHFKPEYANIEYYPYCPKEDE